MLLYLDNCCFNRPFDDLSQISVRLEAEAKLFIQDGIKNGIFDLVWSYILDFENESNPFQPRKDSIRGWRLLAIINIEESPPLLDLMDSYVQAGLKPVDALHVACAATAGADYFITTDKRYSTRRYMASNWLTQWNLFAYWKINNDE